MANHVWTEAEINYIRENAGILRDEEMASILTQLTGRYISLGCLRKKRARLGVEKRMGRGLCEIRKPDEEEPIDP